MIKTTIWCAINSNYFNWIRNHPPYLKSTTRFFSPPPFFRWFHHDFQMDRSCSSCPVTTCRVPTLTEGRVARGAQPRTRRGPWTSASSGKMNFYQWSNRRRLWTQGKMMFGGPGKTVSGCSDDENQKSVNYLLCEIKLHKLMTQLFKDINVCKVYRCLCVELFS